MYKFYAWPRHTDTLRPCRFPDTVHHASGKRSWCSIDVSELHLDHKLSNDATFLCLRVMSLASGSHSTLWLDDIALKLKTNDSRMFFWRVNLRGEAEKRLQKLYFQAAIYTSRVNLLRGKLWINSVVCSVSLKTETRNGSGCLRLLNSLRSDYDVQRAIFSSSDS